MNLQKTPKYFLYFMFAMLISCNKHINNDKATNEAKHTSFERSVFEILEAYNQKDEIKINQFISKKYKIAVLFRRGALDNLVITDSIKFSNPIPEYLSYDYGFATYKNQIKYEQLPEYDCTNEMWNKPPGIYTDTITIDESRSTIAKDEKKFEIQDWSDDAIKQIEATEKVSRKIIIVGNDGGTFIFFLTKHNDNWYLSGIDRFEVCSA
ncbi:hypothetical protein J2X31_002192 [Flavobacterium arsenatis]|uniref:Lipoprotein n=1 Tax=Flavobacterium arsenatis TaxID=1484332 RepID=A0ABU1TQD8_9FLAO|nr:hypothetical protein [Flavobacterium arsenatis]MDR6968177.1 hypothetical protein [Flavobacterium arsenatis]